MNNEKQIIKDLLEELDKFIKLSGAKTCASLTVAGQRGYAYLEAEEDKNVVPLMYNNQVTGYVYGESANELFEMIDAGIELSGMAYLRAGRKFDVKHFTLIHQEASRN
jgi:hypothetical protein